MYNLPTSSEYSILQLHRNRRRHHPIQLCRRRWRCPCRLVCLLLMKLINKSTHSTEVLAQSGTNKLRMTHISEGILPPRRWNSSPWAKLDASCVLSPLCRCLCVCVHYVTFIITAISACFEIKQKSSRPRYELKLLTPMLAACVMIKQDRLGYGLKMVAIWPKAGQYKLFSQNRNNEVISTDNSADSTSARPHTLVTHLRKAHRRCQPLWSY
jgi:hypothetical protein